MAKIWKRMMMTSLLMATSSSFIIRRLSYHDTSSYHIMINGVHVINIDSTNPVTDNHPSRITVTPRNG
eukprot:3343167-Prymnesium_polylepis.3